LTYLDLRVSARNEALEITWTMPDKTASRRDGVSSSDKSGELDESPVRNESSNPQCIIVPYKPQLHKRRREIILPANTTGYVQPIRESERQNLLRAIALGRTWLQEVIGGVGVTLSGIAVREKKSERSIRMTLSLAFLDPKLVRLAVQGNLPRGFGTKRLVELPML
jgi:site-specific DNA recombinase